MKLFHKWLMGYGIILILTLVVTQWGSHAITVFSENSPITRNQTIIIDPGHGGIDGGAISCTGQPESQLNLSISLKLNDLLQLLGYQTRMTRMEDISIYERGESIAQKKISDLKERVKIVNKTDNGLLLSIHQNAFSDLRYHGAQLFYAGTDGSQELAQLLQENFISHLNPDSNRQAKKSKGIYLMEHIEKTGVLIECGFLSNPEEEAKLRSEDYQKKICCVIASALSKYLSNT